MRRRTFTALAGAAALRPLAALADRPPRVGVLWHAANAEQEREYLPVLTKAFADLGYVDGRTVVLEHRFPDEQRENFRRLARQLVEEKVDLIVAATSAGAVAAKEATGTLPIVVVITPDPVSAGLVESLAHPGGNVTGLSLMGLDISGKCLAFLKEAKPGLSRVALLYEPAMPAVQRSLAAYRAAAVALKIELRPLEVSGPGDLDPAFAEIARAGFGGVVVGPGSMVFNERERLGAAVLAHKLPTMVNIGEMVPYGPLMSYGQDFPDYFRRAAAYADRILKGARPGDLPIEQPTHLKLVINLRTAKSLGLDLPATLLFGADEVIE